MLTHDTKANRPAVPALLPKGVENLAGRKTGSNAGRTRSGTVKIVRRGRDFQNYMDAVAGLMAELNGGQRPTESQSGLSANLHPGGMTPAGGAATVGYG